MQVQTIAVPVVVGNKYIGKNTVLENISIDNRQMDFF